MEFDSWRSVEKNFLVVQGKQYWPLIDEYWSWVQGDP